MLTRAPVGCNASLGGTALLRWPAFAPGPRLHRAHLEDPEHARVLRLPLPSEPLGGELAAQLDVEARLRVGGVGRDVDVCPAQPAVKTAATAAIPRRIVIDAGRSEVAWHPPDAQAQLRAIK